MLLLSCGAMKAQDVPDSKDPAGMKRYEGSEIIGYRAPKFDEYLLPLGKPTSMSSPLAYEKSKQIEGQVSYYTYLAPDGAHADGAIPQLQTGVSRLGLQMQYEKSRRAAGMVRPDVQRNRRQTCEVSADSGLRRSRRAMCWSGRTKDAQPSYYVVFVTDL